MKERFTLILFTFSFAVPQGFVLQYLAHISESIGKEFPLWFVGVGAICVTLESFLIVMVLLKYLRGGVKI